MCGIVAYVGHRQAREVVIKGLKRLEYRGYDSAGIALMNGGLNVYKKKGKVSELEKFLLGKFLVPGKLRPCSSVSILPPSHSPPF